MKKLCLMLVLAAIGFIFAGCATQEGGSSLPWSKPEPWEGQTIPMVQH